MAVIGALRVDLGLETAQFKKGAKEAENAAGELYNKIKEFGTHLVEAFAIKELAEGFMHIVEGMESVVLSAQKMGIPVDQLSKLQLAADVTHTSMETLGTGIEKLSKNLEAVAGGHGGNAAAALRALGLSAVDANGKVKQAGDFALELADKYQKTADGTNKVAIGLALMGKGAAELTPFLNRGSVAIAEMEGEAVKLQLAFSEQEAAKIEHFSRNLTTLEDSAIGLGRMIVERLLIPLNSLSDAMVAFSESGQNAQSIVGGMTDQFQALSDYILETGKEFAYLKNVWDLFQQTPSETFNGGWQKFLEANARTTAEWADKIKAARVEMQLAYGAGKGDLEVPSGIKGGEDKKPQMPGFTALTGTVKDYDKAIQALIADLKIKNEEMTKGSLQMKIDQELQRAGIHATEQERDTIRQLVIEHEQNAAKMQTEIQIAANLAAAKQKFYAGLEEIASMGVDALDSWISGAKSLGDALTGVLKQLASMAVQAALFGKGNLGGTGGGLFGGIFGSLFGSGGPSFAGLYADGGSIPSGQWGIAGEAGPEIVHGPATVVPAGAMGRPNLSVVINNNASPDLNISATQTGDGGIAIAIEKKIASTIASGGADRALQGRLGALPQRVRR